MKIIALDIDGVLNYNRLRRTIGKDAICQDAVNCLVAILKETDAKIVISSNWRAPFVTIDSFKESFQSILEQNGIQPILVSIIMDAIIDKTLDFDKLNRGAEVKEWWLENANDIEALAILDDDKDIFADAGLDEHLFITDDLKFGLNWSVAKKVIAHLNGKA